MPSQVTYRRLIEVLEDMGGLPIPDLDDVEWALVRERAALKRDER